MEHSKALDTVPSSDRERGPVDHNGYNVSMNMLMAMQKEKSALCTS